MTQKKFFNRINNWGEYVEAQKKLNNKEKGNTFEILTKLYFKISPKYSFYENVWLLDEVPEKILQEIGLPRLDLGIDLIAKTENEYHAIQCKYHSDKHQAVTFREVSTFLSAIAKCDKITMGYICSTANVTSKNYDKVPKKPISKILSDTWENLTLDFFKNLRASLKRKPLKLEIYKPRPHQKKAISDAVNHFKNNDRGKLIFPCGSGKSLTGFWITRKLNSKNILIAVPSLSLIKQTLDVYLGQIVARKEKVKWLCICSDDGIGKSDDVALLTEDVGVPCITDPNYIRNWLQKNKNDKKIIFTTYQSGKLIAEISKKLKLKFNLGIFDEAHKTVGSELSLFSHLLFEKHINISKRVFMTATERYYSGSKDDIVSMNDIDIYGKVFSKMTFKDAIENKLLTDYKIVTLKITNSEISDFIVKNGLIALNKKWKNKSDARSLASMIALRKMMEKYPINNAVSFHSSIEKAKRNSEIQTYITDNYKFSPITTYTVSGKQSASLRNDIISDFANTKKSLITNARCLTEGVDVPNIDCIVFADPKKSKIDIVQALGRALRKKVGKEFGYVIIPIVYNDNHEVDNESFNELVTTIRGLAANDERIIEHFKTKTFSAGGGNKIKVSDSVFEMIAEKELSDSINIKVWEKLSKFSFLTYEEGKKIVHRLKLKRAIEWRSLNFSKLNSQIPHSPSNYYKNKGWISWEDWLGYKPVRRKKDHYYANYQQAKKILKKLNINSGSEFNKLSKQNKLPGNIPKNPRRYYDDKGWVSMGDFLSTGRIADRKRKFLPFEEARSFIRTLGLKSQKDWMNYKKDKNFPLNIPKNPGRMYKSNGWEGIRDWIGTTDLKKYHNYDEAKKWALKNKIKTQSEWKKKLKPEYYPQNPERCLEYKNDWVSWQDFLETKPKYLEYNDAKKFVKNLNITSAKEWRDYSYSDKIPHFIPKHPYNYYKKTGWKSFGDWLGTGRVADWYKSSGAKNSEEFKKKKLTKFKKHK